jgi:hypothetical protein
MNQADEATRLRVRQSGLLAASESKGSGLASGGACLVARTTTLNNYPATATSFFACNPITVLGAEVESGAGIKTASSSAFLALNLGSAIPPAGTEIIATLAGGRWVFRYDG